MKRRTFVTILSAVMSIGIIFALFFLGVFLRQDITLSAVISAIFIALLLIIMASIDQIRNELNTDIENSLELSYKEVLNHGDIGILTYDDNYEITFMSDFFEKRNMDHLGEKILNWLPELEEMLSNEANDRVVIINDEKFSVRKVDNASLLTFKNITSEYDLQKRLEAESDVLGLLSYDNYDEATMSEDELSYINANIKVPVIEYFRSFGVIYKTLKNSNLLLMMNESDFEKIRNDRFSVLNTVRKVAKEGNVDVTISMAFARGYDTLDELDESCEELLELAQTRGGDQVVVREAGNDPTYYGGTTEAREKQSKTKVRINANALKDLIEKSSNVIICGHKEMDADCIGSALCIANISMSLGKKTYIISKSGGIEPMINDVMNRYSLVLNDKHHLVSENEAINQYNDDSLVIMVDHHLSSTSNGSNLLKNAKKVVILDHHRRRADLDVVAMMMYIEASASSATEIVVEFLPYFSKNIEITPEEANIMYLGILIDTDHFRVRTGSRTFDVAKELRRYGADPMVCDALSRDSYSEVIQKSRIINAGKEYRKGIIIASVSEGYFTRTLASKASDELVKANGVDATFVICYSDKDEVIVSARSKGSVNVQVIMEAMHGGGHMTAAGLQVSDSSVAKVENDLLKVLDNYFEGDINESNSVN